MVNTFSGKAIAPVLIILSVITRKTWLKSQKEVKPLDSAAGTGQGNKPVFTFLGIFLYCHDEKDDRWR